MEFIVAIKLKEMDNEQREASKSLRLFGLSVLVRCMFLYSVPSSAHLVGGTLGRKLMDAIWSIATPWSLNDTTDPVAVLNRM